ncbi:MAG: 50S ribosomal protein L21 [Candidatus Dojkabacteria bacterium]
MAKFAIIQIEGAQYNIIEGKTYEVPKFIAEAGKAFSVKEVLAVGDEKSFEFGKPMLDKAVVTLDIVEQGKGEKVSTNQFRAKSRYRRSIGHRKEVTKFVVKSIK